jgi:hypothetical protein
MKQVVISNLKLEKMKVVFKLIICTATWIVAATGLFAQEQLTGRNKTPRWISDKGSWQIESNIHSPDTSIVYFYDNQKVLVYKEHVKGIVLDLNDKRIRMRLKRALEKALSVWNNNHVLQADQQFVSVLFR